MARTNDVQTALWGDPEYLALPASARHVYLWSFTNPECGMAGVYRLSKPTAMFQTGYSAEQLEDALSELQRARFLLVADGWVWVRTRVKHLRSQTKDIATSIVRDLKTLPYGHPIGPAFYVEYRESTWGQATGRGALGDLLDTTASEDREDWLLEPDPTTSPHHPTTTGHHPSGTPAPPQHHASGVGAGVEVGGSTKKPRARATPKAVDPNALPDDFPDHLVAVLDGRVMPALTRLAEAKGALVVTRAAVARVMVAYPSKDHAGVAEDVEHYWVHGPGAGKPRSDIVQTYRNRIKDQPDQSPRHLSAVVGGSRILSNDEFRAAFERSSSG